MITKKAVIACIPTQPVPLGLLLVPEESVAKFLEDSTFKRLLPLSVVTISLGTLKTWKLSDATDAAIVASSTIADMTIDNDSSANTTD